MNRGLRPRRTSCALACVVIAWQLGVGGAQVRAEATPEITVNRRFEVLPAPQGERYRETLAAAAEELGSWKIELSGVVIDGPVLQEILASEDPELLRATRERLRRPVDLGDLAYFLDDVLRAGRDGLRGSEVVVPSGRARAAGILIHPQEVFGTEAREYGRKPTLAIDRPQPPRTYEPAIDGELLGPRWTARFENPETEPEMLAALAAARSQSGLAERIQSLLSQLRRQQAVVALTSTVRRRERGYLMWGAFLLSRAATQDELDRIHGRLERANRDWGLGVPIRWRHPDGWTMTREAARSMADTYEVVYATEEGARASNHYDGVAVDFVALGLPASLELEAPDGTRRRFDLSAPRETRDLSLSPELIEWIERHFALRKLRSDYPHWDDARGSSESGP